LRRAVACADDGAMGERYPEDVPVLSDDVVTLRAHRESDVDGMVEQCVDPESIRWTHVPVPFGRTDATDYLAMIGEAWRSGREYGFAVQTDDVPFAGSISLRAHGDGVAEIAFGLHPAARGRGVCTRAVNLLLDWGFTRFEVVLWLAQVGNWASRRVVWTTGFTFDGTVAKLLRQRGERFDAWTGSLRATDERAPAQPWHTSPELTSDRLLLRPVEPADADRFGELLRDPRSKYYGGRVRVVRELTDGLAMIDRIRHAQANGERYDWCIADAGTGLMVGHIQLFDLHGLDDTEAKLGYSVHPDSRGRGVLRSALGMVVEWAFRPVADGGLGKRRLSLTTAASNKASRHAVEQAGFTHIGTEPEAFTIGEEGFDDMAIYHRLNPNWTTASANPSA